MAQKSSHFPFFDDVALRLCGVASLLLLCMPPDGIPGVELCAFRAWTGLPCPGCGLTRSGAHLLRGHIGRAPDYNPFGLIIIPAMLVLGLLGVMPRPWREIVRTRLLRWDRTWIALLTVLVIALLVWGWLRCLWVWLGWSNFPATWF